MLKNNLKIAIRHLKRSKTASLINIFGLALALAAAFFIWEYIRLEKSYDRFHAKAERIYRLPIKSYRQGVLETNDAMNAAPAGPAIKSEYPEVEAFVRFTPVYQRTVFKSGEKQFEEDKIFYADSTLFDVFDFPVLEGDAQSCLDRPYTIIITRSVAERYFGPKAFWSESPIGQTIRINNEQDYEITAILEDVPENSHFKFNALISFGTFLAVNGDPSKLWRWNDFYTYILLREGTDVQKFASKIDEFNKRHYQWDVDGFYGETELQPLTDIHLHSKLGYEAEANGDANTIYFLSLIGLAIVIIAWVNYINLTTSGAEQRAGEVGVRKIIGASRKFLMGQFLTEALLVNSLAIALGVVLVRLGHPIMSALVDKQLPGFFTNPGNLLFLPLLLICGTLLAGLYPAWMLSSFSPAKTLKGEKQGSGKGLLRRGLVVFQYAVSVMLIIGTFVIYRQLEFMKGQDLGFAMDQQLIINTPTSVGRNDLFAERYQSFKKQLLDIPEIEYVGGSSAIPGKNYLDLDQHDDIRMQGAAEEKNASFSGLYMDDGFLEVFGLRLLAGRNFSEVPKVDYHSVIINESALALLELKDPEDAIGKMVNYQGDLRKIVGVVSDYHHKSLQHSYEPMIFRNFDSQFLYFSVKFKTGNAAVTKDLISKVQNSWAQFFGDNPFNYFFLDEHFNAQYQAEQRLGKIIGLFSFLAITIACLGLFGLAAFMVSVRTKEIGIRKVLGASVAGLIGLLSKDFIKLVMIALLLGAPLAWYLMDHWLQNFPYRISIHWWVFVLAGLIAIGIAFVTVSLQSVRAALANPVESLKSE